MKKWLAFIFMLMLTLVANGAEVAGIRLPDRVQLSEEGPQLVLNGAGIRKKFFFSVNVVALYLPELRRTTVEVLELPGPKRVTLIMLRDVSAEQFIDAFNDGLNNNTAPEELERLQPQIEAFKALMHDLEEVQEGDLVYLDYVPESGTQLTLNGDAQGAPIEGAGFYAALLRSWLGERPADPNLKRALLGATHEE